MSRGGPTCAVVTVAYRSDGELGEFLDSIAVASTEQVVTIVADNLPSAGDAARIAADHGASYLPMTGNLGYGGAINAAGRTLPDSVEWVLISNPDVVLEPGALDVLIARASGDDRIGSVGPRILNEDGSVYPSARAIPSIRFGIGHALFSRVWVGNPWTRRYHAADAAGISREAGWLSGACLLVRRAAFEGIRGFDEEFFMYFEDVDLGFRLGRAGWINVYEPSTSATHHGARSTSTESAAMILAHHRSAERFLAKRYSSPWLAPVRLILLAGLRLRAAFASKRS